MKRMIKAAGTASEFTKNDLLKILKDHDIDTPVHTYELMAEKYDRGASNHNYTRTFKCPGNWLAYLAMALHATPTPERIEDYFGDVDDFVAFVEANPTERDIEDYAAAQWWGDGDDYIYYLKNKTTGEILYSANGDEDVDEGKWESDWEENEDDIEGSTSVEASDKPLAVWPNGMPVTEDEAIDVLMFWFGEDGRAAKQDLQTISRGRLQQAVDYYADRHDFMLPRG